MKHVAAWITTIAFCAVIYALTLASTDPVDLLTGAVLAVLVLLVIHDFMVETRVREAGVASPPLWARLIWFVPFLAAVARDVIAGTWDVLLYTLGFRSFENAGIVRIPIGERTRSGVAVSAWAITLSPGSALVDVDWELGEMLIHVLEADHAESIAESYMAFYNRYQRRIFP